MHSLTFCWTSGAAPKSANLFRIESATACRRGVDICRRLRDSDGNRCVAEFLRNQGQQSEAVIFTWQCLLFGTFLAFIFSGIDLKLQSWRFLMKSTSHLRKSFLFTLISIFCLGVSSFGQTNRTAHVTVPFEFWVGDTRLPAGTYELTHAISPTLVVFAGVKPDLSSEAFLLPVDEAPVKQSEAKLIFALRKGNYYLYEIRGRFGTRMVSAEYGFPEPKGDQRLEVPVIYR